MTRRREDGGGLGSPPGSGTRDTGAPRGAAAAISHYSIHRLTLAFQQHGAAAGRAPEAFHYSIHLTLTFQQHAHISPNINMQRSASGTGSHDRTARISSNSQHAACRQIVYHAPSQQRSLAQGSCLASLLLAGDAVGGGALLGVLRLERRLVIVIEAVHVTDDATLLGEIERQHGRRRGSRPLRRC